MPIGFDEIKVEEISAGKIVTLKFKEMLSKRDYEEFVPQLEGFLNNGRKIRLLVELHDFKGWTAGALWEDTKFAAGHFNDIEKLAVVGDAQWEKGVAFFIKPFTGADVQYFETNDIAEARSWIKK
jgi:hypothetical protein